MDVRVTASASAAPVVSFVVPCYKLAHLLPECIGSILGQTYRDFEVLILDDCSPDNTPEVAQSFGDARVRHIRNEPNLGHLRNYNKGIALARGRYVWLVSADDYLCRPDVLAEYVRVMDAHPDVGYACASGFELFDNGICRTAAYSKILPSDRIFEERELLHELLRGNAILASSGLVRKSCYDRWGAFPLDLPYAGDWYLWCLFALHYSVAYFAREAVAYRIHASSMTESLLARDARVCVADDLRVLWRMKEHAREAGAIATLHESYRALGAYYARYLVSRSYRSARFFFTDEEFQASVRLFSRHPSEVRAVLFHAYSSAADLAFRTVDAPEAKKYAFRALMQRPWNLRVWLKAVLLLGGRAGTRVREWGSALVRGKAIGGTLSREEN